MVSTRWNKRDEAVDEVLKLETFRMAFGDSMIESSDRPVLGFRVLGFRGFGFRVQGFRVSGFKV